jgi:hypothetical protein
MQSEREKPHVIIYKNKNKEPKSTQTVAKFQAKCIYTNLVQLHLSSIKMNSEHPSRV